MKGLIHSSIINIHHRLFTYICIVVTLSLCAVSHDMTAQTFTLSKSVSNTNPNNGQPFNYIIDAACNSTTRDCETAVITDCLPPELEFLNVSNPLPDGVSSATYDPNTHCITIRFDATACSSCTPDGVNSDNDDFAQGSTVQLAIQVQFPSGTFNGVTVNNTANGTSANAGNPSDSAPTVTSQGPNPQTGCNQVEAYHDVGSSVIPRGLYQMRITGQNLGISDITNFVTTTYIPSEISFSQIRSPQFTADIDHEVDVYYELSSQPGNYIFWATVNLNNDRHLFETDLGLTGNVEVTSIRLDWGTLSGDGLFNPNTWDNTWDHQFKIYGFVKPSYNAGTVITSCTDVTANVGGLSCPDNDCDSATVSAGSPTVTGNKEIQDQSGEFDNSHSPGDTYRVHLNYANPESGNAPIRGAVMVDVLPPCMSYVPGSYQQDWGSDNNNQTPVIQTGTVPDGREYVRFVWDSSFGNSFTIPPTGSWDGFGISFEVQIGYGCGTGTFQNEYYYSPTGSNQQCYDATVTTPVDGGYSYTGNMCFQTRDIIINYPPGSAGLESYKEVLGTKDANYHRYPTVGETVPGGLNDYRICVSNPNPTPINDIVLIDLLPKLGDTEVLDISVPRGTQWEPILSSPISPPSGVTVQYSTESFPCRDELAGPSDPLPFPSGCSPPNWSSTPPPDLSLVTAIRFDFGSTTLNQNDQVCIDWDMRAPIGTPTNAVAWNSFAYSASNADTDAALLPAEPIKVGIELVPGSIPIKGDFVWNDQNGNGVQDSGEPGIDGVTVNLYQDSDNDGVAEPGSDQLYTYTISQAGGQYIFTDFPFGDYFIEFTDLPSGYNPTHTNAGSDDAIDSDGLITEVFTVTSTTDNRTCDLGLFLGSPPPLCDLIGGIETGGSCGASLASNGGFENSGSTNFNTTYQGIPAASVTSALEAAPGWNIAYTTSGTGQTYYINDAANQVNNPEGDKFIFLNNNGYCWTQSMTLNAGTCYNLSFMAAAFSSAGGTANAELEVYLSGFEVIGENTLTTSSNFNNMNWEQVSGTFTPSETKTYNLYVSTSNFSGTFNGGVAIDNFVVTECCNTICAGEQVTLTASGITSNPPISYLWSTGSTANSINVSPTSNAVYSVTMTDANNCQLYSSAIINVNPNPTASISSNNISCFGESNGTATASGAGGSAPYQFTWSHGPTSPSVTGLGIGSYTVTVTDSNGCQDTASASITEPSALQCSVSRDKYVSCDCGNNGIATVSPSGGTPPYSYAWSNGETTQQATTLGKGTHNVTVTDANGCTTTCSINMEINPSCCFSVVGNGFLRFPAKKN